MLNRKFPLTRLQEKGAITPILAVGMVAMLGILALGIDLGQLFLVKNELQNIADAAALAGAKKLVQDRSQVATVCCDEAIAAAQAVAAQNRSSGQAMSISPGDVVFGQWDLKTGAFTSQGCSTNPILVNAIQVTVKRLEGGGNPEINAFFAGIFGSPKLNSQATAVAYLGLAGSSALDLPFAVPPNYPAGGTPYASLPSWLTWLAPPPAYASDPQEYTWKDLGGESLDTTRGSFVMPKESERTDLARLQKYIKGPGSGNQYPQLKIGQKVYPISEYRWPTNVYNNFNYLKTRYNAAPKVGGKWRVTVAVYSPTPVTAAAPKNSWSALMAKFLPWPTPAYACASYTTPAVYVQGFASVDVTEVSCNSSCKNYDYPDSRSCYKTCYAKLEVPLNQNTMSTDKTSNPIPFQRDYRDMNPGASEVGVFASVPRLVK